MHRAFPTRLDPAKVLALFVLSALHVALLRLPWGPDIRRDQTSSAPALQLVNVIEPRAEERALIEEVRPEIETNLPAPALPSVAPLDEFVEDSEATDRALPPIDWTSEAARAAESELARLNAKQQRRAFDRSDRAPSPLEVVPRELQQDDFPWSESGNGEGSVAIVKRPYQAPYLLLWDRCVIFPPLFACGIGKLPPARGDLFEGMDDVHRPRSSVPNLERSDQPPP